MILWLAGVDRHLTGPVKFCFQVCRHNSSTDKTRAPGGNGRLSDREAV